MGIFSSKYKTTVGTSITRVIEDDNIPNSVLLGVTKSILRSDDQMVEYAMEELINSIGIRANRMYDYGRKKYPHGIPTGTLLNVKSGEILVKQAIEEEYGPVVIDYYRYGSLNTLHYGWMKLQDIYQYNSATNQLIVGGVPVYLVDMIVCVKEATVSELANGSLDHWGVSPKSGKTENRSDSGKVAGFSLFETDATALVDYLRVKYHKKIANDVIEEGSFNIPVSGIDTLADFHHACYIKNGQLKYWLYRADSGVHQALDKIHSTEHSAGGSYFPWAYFRYNKVSTVDNKTTQEFKTSKRLLDYIGLDYETVGTTINANPDIADVEQAMLMMAVPANSTNPMEVRYLYDFFSGLYSTQIATSPETAQSEGIQSILRKLHEGVTGTTNSLVIQDKKFKMTLDYRRITKAKRIGVLGKIGTYQGGYGAFTEVVNGKTVTHDSEVKFHYYRRQITGTVYEEIRVEGLTMKYHIFEDYYETADENEDILLIPVDMAIVENYSIMDREILYCRALHYVFNSRIITKIKWYQRGAFKILMIIVAIIITIYTWGAGAGILGAVLSASTATITAALIALAIDLLIQYLIALAFKMFIKMVGGKLALIFAVVVMIYAGYIGFQAGSVSGAPFANELLSLSTNLVEASFNDIMKEKYENLQEEYSEFNDLISSKKELLERAKDELSYNKYLTPAIIFGEEPSQFFDRTVHSGNIGVLAIDAMSSYYDIALSLPKLQESLGEE